jgi:hypothetical protein
MQKKIFLQRNNRKATAAAGPYLKYLVIAAVCLVILVLVTPYLFKGKNKDITKRPMPDRGAVTKEVPKALEPVPQMPLEAPRAAEPVKPAEVATAPEPMTPVQVQPAPKPQESSPEVAIPQKAVPEPPVVTEKAPALEPGPKDLFPKKSSLSEAPPAALPKAPAKPATTTASAAPAAKPSAPAGKGNYAVQVGNTFKSKPEAEAVRRDLAKKGYSAVVRPAKKGSGYCVTTSPSVASKAYTLQEQMKIQGLNTTAVIKVEPGPEPAPKSAAKKPPVPANGGYPQQ